MWRWRGCGAWHCHADGAAVRGTGTLMGLRCVALARWQGSASLASGGLPGQAAVPWGSADGGGGRELLGAGQRVEANTSSLPACVKLWGCQWREFTVKQHFSFFPQMFSTGAVLNGNLKFC